MGKTYKDMNKGRFNAGVPLIINPKHKKHFNNHKKDITYEESLDDYETE